MQNDGLPGCTNKRHGKVSLYQAMSTLSKYQFINLTEEGDSVGLRYENAEFWDIIVVSVFVCLFCLTEWMDGPNAAATTNNNETWR